MGIENMQSVDHGQLAQIRAGSASSGGGAGGSTEVNALKATVDLAEAAFLKLFKGLTGVHAKAPDEGVGKGLSMTNTALVKADGTANPIPEARGGFLANLAASVLNLKEMWNGVGGDILNAGQVAQVDAPPVAPNDHNVDFSMLIGDASGHGKYSVADISGGGNLTPIGPMQNGGMFIG